MRVFVTGGTGLVGRHTIAALRARGDAVLALVRGDAGAAQLAEAGADVLRGDIEDAASLERGAAEADATVHAAAVVLSRGGWEHHHAVNVRPVEAVARACARSGTALVHVSSVAVYGRRTTYERGPSSVTEAFGLDAPIFAGDHYARSKREAEQALWRVVESTGLRAVALRPCVIYGEWDRHFSPRVAAQLRRGWAPQIGGGANVISVVYAGNVASAVLAALDRREATGAFNVANDGTLTQREFVARFAAGLQTRLRILRVPQGLAWHASLAADAAMRLLGPARPATPLRTAVQFLAGVNPYTSARAEQVLGWRPAVAALEAVERTGRWFRTRA
jgi:nucleoside-diphosphate-sugar epimerase